MAEKYVAYVAGYTRESDYGLKIYDVDMKKGRMKERSSVRITNPSYITTAHNGKLLYSITDEGVQSYTIEQDGGLTEINRRSINGMRGCYISTDYEDRFLFVAGYHDGKVTVLSLKKDGAIDRITDEIYHKGLGSVSERNFRPHINCVKMTRDNKFLCVTDVGMDHVKIYRLDHKSGKLELADIIRSNLQSQPRHIKFSQDGKFAYVIHEALNYIDVYTYEVKNEQPYFEKIQTVPTLNEYHAGGSAASSIQLSADGKYVFCSNAGDNSVGAFSRDPKTGLLEKIFILPVSGDYPKDIAVTPNNKYLFSLNNESSTITFFTMDLKAGTLIMNGPSLPFNEGNCILIHKVGAAGSDK
ncbi:MAG: lactonase family protein [Lachnospiraceae bacterium]|nr:lactonase family protein [Lachnospiraceae bacterium]